MNLNIKGLDRASRVVVETLEVRVLADRSHAARRPLRLSCAQIFLSAFLSFSSFLCILFILLWMIIARTLQEDQWGSPVQKLAKKGRVELFKWTSSATASTGLLFIIYECPWLNYSSPAHITFFNKKSWSPFSSLAEHQLALWEILMSNLLFPCLKSYCSLTNFDGPYLDDISRKLDDQL